MINITYDDLKKFDYVKLIIVIAVVIMLIFTYVYYKNIKFKVVQLCDNLNLSTFLKGYIQLDPTFTPMNDFCDSNMKRHKILFDDTSRVFNPYGEIIYNDKLRGYKFSNIMFFTFNDKNHYPQTLSLCNPNITLNTYHLLVSLKSCKGSIIYLGELNHNNAFVIKKTINVNNNNPFNCWVITNRYNYIMTDNDNMLLVIV